VADIGLQAVDGEDHAAFARRDAPEALGIGERQGEELVVAVEQVGDAARADVDAAVDQVAVDLGDAAVLGVAQGADAGDEVEPEFMGA
jgi:hypothetical protein